MKSFVQKFSKVKTGLALILTLGLAALSHESNAATFTAKAGTGLLWNGGSTTWTITNGTPLNSSYPSYNDQVIINAGNRVTINIATAECGSLEIEAGGGGTTSLLDVDFRKLNVFGTVTISGGNINSPKIAELRVATGGSVDILSTISPSAFPTTSSEANRITVPVATQIVVNKSSMTPLPVSLTSFTAIKKNAEVALAWETASEKNNTGFEVQASFDGKNYEAIGFVASKNGNSNTSQRYAYAHKVNSTEGLVYYRLKQVDMDGTSEYYTAKVVDLGRLNASVNTFPNPFQNNFELNLTAATAETAQVIVTDMAGKTVYQNTQKLQKGANTLNVEIKNQPAGLYLLKATTGNQTYTNRLVKQ